MSELLLILFTILAITISVHWGPNTTKPLFTPEFLTTKMVEYADLQDLDSQEPEFISPVETVQSYLPNSNNRSSNYFDIRKWNLWLESVLRVFPRKSRVIENGSYV